MSSYKPKKFAVISEDELLLRVLPARLKGEGILCESFGSFAEFEQKLTSQSAHYWGVVCEMGAEESGLMLLEKLGKRKDKPEVRALVGDRETLKRYFERVGQLDAVFERPLRLDKIIEEIHETIQHKNLPRVRRFERSDVDITIELKSFRLPRPRRFRVRNASAGGVFVESDGSALAVGDSVLFTLHEGNRRHLAIRGIGRVCWASLGVGGRVRGFGVELGTFFYNVTHKDVERFLKERLPAPPRARLRLVPPATR